MDCYFLSGYQDSNLGPPAPKAGALTGLRYIPKHEEKTVVCLISWRKDIHFFLLCKVFAKLFEKIVKIIAFYTQTRSLKGGGRTPRWRSRHNSAPR